MNLKDIPQEILNNIFSYVDPIDLHTIGRSMPVEIGPYIINATQHDLYWKHTVETLLEVYLPDDVNRNWLDVYRNLSNDPLIVNVYTQLPRYSLMDSMLATASKHGYTDIVGVILVKHHSHDYTLLGYRECLTVAATNGHIDIVKLFLVDHTSVSPNTRGMFGRFALIGAASKGYLDTVKLLLQDGRIQQGDSEALYVATMGNHTDIVRLLLDDVEPQRGDWLHNTEPYNIKKALIYASKLGYISIVSMLLEDKRIHQVTGISRALQLACKAGRIDVVKVFLASRGITALVIDWSILNIAVSHGQYDVVKLLLEDGRADPTLRRNALLQSASARGCLDIVTLLLSDERVKSK